MSRTIAGLPLALFRVPCPWSSRRARRVLREAFAARAVSCAAPVAAVPLARHPRVGDAVDLGDLVVVDAAVVERRERRDERAGVVRRRGAEVRQPPAPIGELDGRRVAEPDDDRLRGRDRRCLVLRPRARRQKGGEHGRRGEKKRESTHRRGTL
jgi:hypothetical protein